MDAGLGAYPEAWLRMQAQEIERGLATRRLRDMRLAPLRASREEARAKSRWHSKRELTQRHAARVI